MTPADSPPAGAALSSPTPPVRGRKAARDGQIGVDSLETGIGVLLALTRLGGHSQKLATIAEEAGMSTPKAHRYLVSFVRTGMIERDTERGFYRLGPTALELGLCAMGAVDALQLAREATSHLRDELGQTIALMVWGARGPVIVGSELPATAVSINVQVGRTLPVVQSASGLVLAAHLPWGTVSPALLRELMRGQGTSEIDTHAVRQLQHQFELIRRRGLSRIKGTVSPGIASLAAPILDLRGVAAASISVVGPLGSFDTRLQGAVAAKLTQACRAVSARLGYRAMTAMPAALPPSLPPS